MSLAWTKAEICKLFDMVALCKKNQKPVLGAFKEFAVRFARKPLSVRNFYYNQLKFFEEDPALAASWGINLNLHKKSLPVRFSEEETRTDLGRVAHLVDSGHSVRSSCKIVAGGNEDKMLRLQNKFHATKQKEKASKVLFMPKSAPSGLTDADINSLVLGLVRLVRRAAEEKAGAEFEGRLKIANIELRKSLKTIAEKQKEIEDYRKRFEVLTHENEEKSEEIRALRSRNVELLSTDTKRVDALKKYLKKISSKPAVKT